MHDTCKRIISKGAKHEHNYEMKIYDISADDEVAPLDQLLQDNCIVELIKNHCSAHLSPGCSDFYKNIGEAHQFFFSRHKDGNYSYRAHQLGYPNDTHANNKQPPKVKAQPAKVMGKQQRLDLSSEEDDSETK